VTWQIICPQIAVMGRVKSMAAARLQASTPTSAGRQRWGHDDAVATLGRDVAAKMGVKQGAA
jgi:hypothetical protein